MIYIGVQKRALHKTSLIFHVKRHYENNAEDTLGSDGKCYNCKQRRFVKNYWWNHPVRFIQLCYGNCVSLNKNFFIKNLTIRDQEEGLPWTHREGRRDVWRDAFLPKAE
ncbi:uncharacterized protein H6S33_011635 [Morchella sextelata]|uniref:uncharacterized protein n=1 Tax=Morchella sextelata TaxID=1174677 RepID=UPI001D036DCA|nr:uncharacterized protein H6S33_011635 [Morchella sextelata]KAH0611208.1 hypothetical protein H6S33_011635 [Morchella sextelata]